MITKKLNPNMSTREMILAMSENNLETVSILTKMIDNSRFIINIYLLDYLEISGSQICTLYNCCCGRDNSTFSRTLMMLNSNVFSKEEVKENFEKDEPIPFIDEDVVIEGAPIYNENYGPSYPKWGEYCDKQREAFINKINKAKVKIKSK